ncbi:hypothetical protein GCM10023107_83930 [Actinoplanes octamycinicus]|nr:hypothetical protein Aoc01nite_67210 [Actinoplanes octamycinicus]
MIAEVALPPTSGIIHVAGIGWLATHRAARSVSVLDAGLRVVTQVPIPVAAHQFEASVSEHHLAAVTLDELVVCDRLGRPLWRREHSIPRAGLPCRPNCHLDSQGNLWVYLPAGDELVTYAAATGAELDRIRLASEVGVAYFFPHPDGRRLGLHVAMGQDTPLSHLAWMSDGRIHGRDVPGAFLNGFTSSGDRYLATPHADVPELAIRDLSTGAVVVACDPAEIAGYHNAGDYRLADDPALVNDDLVLVAVNTDGFATAFQDHLLLSTRSLRWQADVDYGGTMTPETFAATDGQGRWVTRAPGGVARLWQLPERITDDIPGQLQLW